MKSSLLLLVISVVWWAGSVSAASPEQEAANTASDGAPVEKSTKKTPLQVVLELRDGSRLVGEPAIEFFTVQTSFAKPNVPLDRIAVIEFDEDHEHVKVQFANGDTIQGVADLPSLPIKTAFGKIVVPRALIDKLSMQAGPFHRGLVLHYSFDKDEGALVTDRSGQGHTGKVQGARWIPDGPVGGAMSFDGKSSIEIGPLPEVNNQPALTFGAWVFVTGATGLNGVLGKTKDHDEVFYLITNNQSGRPTVQFMVVTVGKGDCPHVEINDVPEMNTWQHLMGTFDGKQIKAYCNGEMIGSSQVYERKLTNPGSAITAVGDTAFGRGWYFHGKLDEVMIFNRALNATEIKQLYESKKGESGTEKH